MNDFQTDDQWQRSQRDRFLLPLFYRKRYNRFQFCDNLPSEQRRGIDTIIWIGNKKFTVDEKIVRKKYDAFALETKSCTVPGYEKPGWMFYGEADRLLYCFSIPNGLDCYTLDFDRLQIWFWPKEKTFPPFQMETKNKSFGRVVNISELMDSGIIIEHFKLTETGE